VILTHTFTSELHVRDDNRVITGTLVPYGQPVQIREYGRTYTEDFAAGAFAADVERASEIELTALHPRSGAELPIGIMLSLTDTPTGLDGEWRVSETEFGTQVLTLVREKALRSLSAGFAEGRNTAARPPPPTVTTLPRPYLDCGQPVVGAPRCPTRAPQTTTARGYGSRHQATRVKLPTAYGQPCTRCGLPMLPGQPLDLDHSDDRTGYAGFAHRRCNQQAGGRKAARGLRLPNQGGSRVIAFVERYLTTPKGTGARKRMQLRPWQRDIVHGLFDEPRP
jgi:hypothetical protein